MRNVRMYSRGEHGSHVGRVPREHQTSDADVPVPLEPENADYFQQFAGQQRGRQLKEAVAEGRAAHQPLQGARIDVAAADGRAGPKKTERNPRKRISASAFGNERSETEPMPIAAAANRSS